MTYRLARPLAIVTTALLLASGPVSAGEPTLSAVCFPDPVGDAADPRQDIVEHCVSNTSGGLAFSVTLAAPPESTALTPTWEFSGGGQVLYVTGTPDSTTAETASRFDRSIVCTRLTARQAGDTISIPLVPHRCLEGTYNPEFSLSLETAQDSAPDSGPGGEFTVDGPVPVQRFSVQRLEATDPVGAALAISRATFPDGAARRVMLSRDDTFADTLAAGGVQAMHFIPLLLTNRASLSDGVLDELRRLGAGEVVLLGGEAAVSSDVAAQLMAEGFAVTRLEGPNRVETAVAVARAFALSQEESGRLFFGHGAVIARAFGAGAGDDSQAFADALGMGPLGVFRRIPVLVTPTETLADSVMAYIAEQDQGAASLTIVGGEAAVGPAVPQQIRDLGYEVGRLGGSTRFETNLAAQAARGMTDASMANRVILIEGQAETAWASGFPAIANAAVGLEHAVVLVNGSEIPDVTREWLAAADPDNPPELVCAPLVDPAACDAAMSLMGLDAAMG